VKETFLDGDSLKAKLVELIQAQSQPAAVVDVDDLKRQRERLRKRTELIVSTFDEETLADAQAELEKLKAERRRLEEHIEAATATTRMPKVDADTLVKEMQEKTKIFFQTLPTMPKHLVRGWLAAAVSTVIVDMDSKAIEIHVQLPKHMLETAFPSQNAMRLVPTSASSTSYEKHQPHVFRLALIHCSYSRPSNSACFDCRRIAA
jgi:multidrug efflux pump subunit AcrA (membrane-fusion protein)